MTRVFLEFLGLLAAFFASGGLLPQALKVIRTKDTSGISALTFGMLTIGAALWTAYGLGIGSPAIIAANTVSFVLAGVVLLMKLANSRQNPPLI